ncbi:hypothetical protein KNE206_53060 [Kitasatospora sp. NE20-6]|uniref:hypothetical protein n=1 Tax=Kitasatospora sp. NE20-6 TaxID=2859066 RepID=UPI0034DBDF8D
MTGNGVGDQVQVRAVGAHAQGDDGGQDGEDRDDGQQEGGPGKQEQAAEQRADEQGGLVGAGQDALHPVGAAPGAAARFSADRFARQEARFGEGPEGDAEAQHQPWSPPRGRVRSGW